MITVLKFLLVIAYVLCSFALIFVVLLQQGKGAGLGASLGGGSSQTLFGSRAPTFISRFTGVLATGFFLGAIVLAKWPPFSPSGAVDTEEILQIEEVVAPAEDVEAEAVEPTTEAKPAEVPDVPEIETSAAVETAAEAVDSAATVVEEAAVEVAEDAVEAVDAVVAEREMAEPAAEPAAAPETSAPTPAPEQ